MNEALRDWVTNVRTTHYCIGSAAGPHPYPELVAHLPERHRRGGARAGPRGAGRAARRGDRVRRRRLERDRPVPRLPEGRGGRARRRRGRGRRRRHRAGTPRRSTAGRVGVLHGSKSYVLCDDGGQIHGGPLDQRRPRLPRRRPGALVAEGQRARDVRLGDRRRGARGRSQLVARTEGIIPALETAHAFARVGDVARGLAGEARAAGDASSSASRAAATRTSRRSSSASVGARRRRRRRR